MTPARRLLLLLWLAVAPAAVLADAPLRLGAELGAGYDGNLGNAERDADRRESGFASAGLSLDAVQPLGSHTALQLRGTLQGDSYFRHDGLSNGRAALLLRLSHRPGGAFWTPTLALWASGGWLEYDSRMRDALEARAGVTLYQQWTTRISARLGAAATQRESASRVFDLRGASGTFALDWDLGPVTAFGSYQHYRGDVASTGAPALKAVAAAEAVEPDDALGGFGAAQFAYRLEGRSHVGTLGLNVPLSRRLALDLTGQRVATEAEGGNAYTRWLGQATLLLRF